jgi:hypothetical protein
MSRSDDTRSSTARPDPPTAPRRLPRWTTTRSVRAPRWSTVNAATRPMNDSALLTEEEVRTCHVCHRRRASAAARWLGGRADGANGSDFARDRRHVHRALVVFADCGPLRLLGGAVMRCRLGGVGLATVKLVSRGHRPLSGRLGSLDRTGQDHQRHDVVPGRLHDPTAPGSLAPSTVGAWSYPSASRHGVSLAHVPSRMLADVHSWNKNACQSILGRIIGVSDTESCRGADGDSNPTARRVLHRIGRWRHGDHD